MWNGQLQRIQYDAYLYNLCIVCEGVFSTEIFGTIYVYVRNDFISAIDIYENV